MPKTAVGLFKNPAPMEDVVREIEGLGFPRLEVRTLAEPASFGLAGVMSFPRLDFEVLLKRELARIGASESEVQAYVRGVEKGGALVLATGPDRNVEAAVQVMNDHGAVGIEQSSGPEPEFARNSPRKHDAEPRHCGAGRTHPRAGFGRTSVCVVMRGERRSFFEQNCCLRVVLLPFVLVRSNRTFIEENPCHIYSCPWLCGR